MFSRQQLRHDAQFLRITYKMGYQHSDIQQIDDNKLDQQSYETTKHMSQVEKSFYLRKKKQALIQRQQKIFHKIYNEYAKDNKTNCNKKNYKYNPVVSQLLIDHENKLNKKARYAERIRVTKSRNAQRVTPNRNTIDLGRTSPNFSSISKYSQVSRKSIKSESSSRASNISRKSSTRDRLQLVRSKQKQQQHLKKSSFQQSQIKSKNKVERVYQQRQSYSRKLKTRSEISQQAVMQKKAQLSNIQNQQIRNHIQSLQYKILKHQVIRQKQIQQKIKNKDPYDTAYKKQIKNMFQQNQIHRKSEQYQNRMKAAQKKRQEVNQKKMIALQQKSQDRKYKQLNSKKYKTHLKYQQAQNGRMIKISQQKSLQQAERKRNQYQSQKKIKLIASRVKQEINRTNLNSLERRKQIQTIDKVKRYSQKIQEINQIQKLKKKLTKQRVSFNGTSVDFKRSRDNSFY